jgi:hypothetical protein
MSWKGSYDLKKPFEVIIKITRHCHFLKTKDSGSRVVIVIKRHSDVPLRKGRMFQVTVLKLNVINFVKNLYGDVLLVRYSVPMYYVIFLK